MVVSGVDLGRVIGQGLRNSFDYRQDFVESEEVTDLNLVGLDTVRVKLGVKVTKKFIDGCSNLPFVIDHPVQGDIDSSSLYIDGGYCSESVVYDDTGDL